MPVKRVFDPNDPEPCAGCGDCCRYVTAQIKSPRARADYDEIRWFLLHENIQVFVDEDGWYIEFATKCRKLDGARCTIYPERPRVCSDYDVENCTRYGDGEPHLHLFRTEQEYLDYLRRHRPRAYEWVMDPRVRGCAHTNGSCVRAGAAARQERARTRIHAGHPSPTRQRGRMMHAAHPKGRDAHRRGAAANGRNSATPSARDAIRR